MEIPMETLVSYVVDRSAPVPAGIYTARISVAGAANIRYGQTIPDDQDCAEFARTFMHERRHTWSDEYLIYFNRPCYLLPRSAAIVLDDGRYVAETIYPSGETTYLEMFGIEPLRPEQFSSFGDAAPDVPCMTPLTARWSSVYYHFLAESMVHDNIVATLFPADSVRRVAAHATAGAEQLTSEIVGSTLSRTPEFAVPTGRLLTSTPLYRFEGIGTQFRLLIDKLKRRFAPANSYPEERAAAKSRHLYVSRWRSGYARQMANEPELEALFERRGFEIVHPEKLTLAEQVALFAEASIVAGPFGSGLTNAAFARPAATLYDLRPLNRAGQSPNWDNSFQRIAATMGLRYWFDAFPNGDDSDDWEVSLPRVERSLDAILSTEQ